MTENMRTVEHPRPHYFVEAEGLDSNPNWITSPNILEENTKDRYLHRGYSPDNLSLSKLAVQKSIERSRAWITHVFMTNNCGSHYEIAPGAVLPVFIEKMAIECFTPNCSGPQLPMLYALMKATGPIECVQAIPDVGSD